MAGTKDGLPIGGGDGGLTLVSISNYVAENGSVLSLDPPSNPSSFDSEWSEPVTPPSSSTAPTGWTLIDSRPSVASNTPYVKDGRGLWLRSDTGGGSNGQIAVVRAPPSSDYYSFECDVILQSLAWTDFAGLCVVEDIGNQYGGTSAYYLGLQNQQTQRYIMCAGSNNGFLNTPPTAFSTGTLRASAKMRMRADTVTTPGSTILRGDVCVDGVNWTQVFVATWANVVSGFGVQLYAAGSSTPDAYFRGMRVKESASAIPITQRPLSAAFEAA